MTCLFHEKVFIYGIYLKSKKVGILHNIYYNRMQGAEYILLLVFMYLTRMFNRKIINCKLIASC